MQLKIASLKDFVRRMRLELTRPCDHYPLKVACIPISPPAQGLFLVERKTGLEPATPTLARLCSTNWAISANFFEICEIFATLNNSSKLDCIRLLQKFRREFISHLRMQSYCFFLIWPNIFMNIFVCLVIVLIISEFYFFYCSLKMSCGYLKFAELSLLLSVFISKNS